jgi:transcriptional regulator with XRE-family HTH domain
MTVVPHGDASLGRRLKSLRESAQLTQRAVADALGGERPLSPALISSWESGRAVPAPRWLTRYAEIFAARTAAAGAPGPEDVTVEQLEAELSDLREGAQARSPVGEDPGTADGLGSFWRFPDGLPIRIIGTPMFEDVLEGLDYANRWHPNYMEFLRNADTDATLELFGHLRAANPASDVRFLTVDTMQSDDLTGHVVLLGGGDDLEGRRSSSLRWFIRRLELPVRTRLPDGRDPEYDTEFVVSADEDGNPEYGGPREEVYRPTFLRERHLPDHPRAEVAGYPQLEYDLGLLVRRPNPMNLQVATVTICSGIFSRGTYGVVRSLTDAKLRDGNEQYLREAFPDGNFWLLMRVPVFPGQQGAETITPDLTREHHVVRQSG